MYLKWQIKCHLKQLYKILKKLYIGMSINIIKSKVTFHSWFSFSITALKLLVSWKQHLNKSVANLNTKTLKDFFFFFFCIYLRSLEKHEQFYINKMEWYTTFFSNAVGFVWFCFVFPFNFNNFLCQSPRKKYVVPEPPLLLCGWKK